MTFRTAFLVTCLAVALGGLWFIQSAAKANRIPGLVAALSPGAAGRAQAVLPVADDFSAADFPKVFMDQVTPLRAKRSFTPLSQDARITQWLADQGTRLTFDTLEQTLATANLTDYHCLRAAGAGGGTLRDLLPGLLEKLGEPASSKDDRIGFLVRTRPGQGHEVILVSAETLPELSLRSLDQGTTGNFVNQCPHCGKRSAYRHEKSSSTLTLDCPACGRAVRLLGRDTKGNYHDATAFLIPSSYPTVAPGTDPLDAMISIWQAAVKRCQYLGDGDNDDEPGDFWQTPRQTLVKGTGDCEDSALLLTDWLLSNEIPARMVLGTVKGGGHAWCVVRVDHTDYLLESTNRNPDLGNLPAVNRNDGYTPSALIDRDALYVRADPEKPFDGDYWSPVKWIRIPNAKPAAPAKAPKISEVEAALQRRTS
jgi:predicted transglutaminase-like cysteine proteinase